MIKAKDYLNDYKLFSVKQIAKAAGCRPVLIMKYIQEGVRGVGRLDSFEVNEHGQPLVSLGALELFRDFHSGYAHYYATQALRVLRGARP